MALSGIITPVAMLPGLVVCVMGISVGFAKKEVYGYLLAVTFLLFALFGFPGQAGVGADTLAILNVVAVPAALAGMCLVLQER